MKRHLSAPEAAKALGVSMPTLYAYVSRGLIRSEEAPEGSRSRLYAAADVKALQARKARGRKAEAVASGALHFGAPVLESALTLIAENKLYYRGRNAAELAASATLEEVARLLWDCDELPFAADNLPPSDGRVRRAWAGIADMPPLDRCLALLPHAAILDDRAWNLDRTGIMECGVRVVRLLAAIVAGMPVSAQPAHRVLAQGWKLDAKAANVLRAALVMSADHELNASAFAVRVVAATGTTVYGSTMAGLAALQGPRHGGVTPRMVTLFGELEKSGDLRGTLRTRLQGGERLPGIGHWLYPDGDPRAKFLLQLLRHEYAGSPALDLALRTAEVAEAMTDRKPNIDFALATIERTLGLPANGGLALFLLGRATGWVAHHLEQSATPQLIRPRARYTGPMPAA